MIHRKGSAYLARKRSQRKRLRGVRSAFTQIFYVQSEHGQKDDVRRSNRSNDRRKNLSGQRNKTHANRDVQYAKDPHYNEEIKSADKYLQNEKYSRLYNRHGSGRSQNENKMHSISFNREPRKFSDRSLRFDASLMAREKKSTDIYNPKNFSVEQTRRNCNKTSITIRTSTNRSLEK
ncbi:hypothetical protein EVAR_18023_1 [Eumeta japonica]|uniref:Uncharacterized protein n=1 Tax=Eumeta variegata TaxID=151549 RepID=A0A4C1ZLG7_EUMVA|nr:hypothetical protein EVAR_18023_1 [Eumeta japonica]